MSDLKVEIVLIDHINPHPNADRLELATIKGWVTVVQRGVHKPGDKVVYFPIDSVLPDDVLNILFGPDAKIQPKKGRIRTIKIRGEVSQGMVAPLGALGIPQDIALGMDVTDTLKVTKYEPDQPPLSMQVGKSRVTKRNVNPNFKKYTDIQHLKNFITALFGFVVVTEKVHGTNFRAGYVETYPHNLLRKILKFFRLLPKYEFVYGSHNVQLHSQLLYRGYYKDNVYAQTVKQYALIERLAPGEVIYGEVYGDGIQKGYSYGLTNGETALAVFDVKVNGKYLDVNHARSFCSAKGLPFVPILGREFIETSCYGEMGKLEAYFKGPSQVHKSQGVREGVVVRTETEAVSMGNRRIFKLINPAYLLKDQTEYH